MISNLKEKIKKSFLGKMAISLRYAHPNTMPKYSYSQTGEDLILDFFLKGKKSGFYMDIGAYHPVSLSNTYRFYKRGWKGINIEPNHNKFHLFEKQRTRDMNLNVGIGPHEASAPLFIFDADTLSTFSREAAENYKSIGHSIVETKEVELMPLKKIFEKYAKDEKIDFLSVDTEGYDLEVLKTNDWELYRPSLIVLETVEYGKELLGKKLNDTYDPFMEAIGYKKIADTYINTIYIDGNIGSL